MSIRAVKSISQSLPTLEGAGVKLRRAFGFGKTGDFDPFLLLDDFRNEHPEDYLPGFPWHPHRGIETITYVLSGSVQHGDSLGNRGSMGAGDVQWMTAGSGILHQEMPKGDEHGRMHGFQLWANLPRSLKMTDPRYQDIHAKEIPEVVDDDGTRVRVVAGDFWGKRGPVEGVAADPRYLDVWIPPRVRTDRVSAGGRDAGSENPQDTGNRSLVLFDSGDEITVQAGEQGMRFLLVSGQPLQEPVAWQGPIVMNTKEELQTAYDELRRGTFIKRD